MDGHPIPTSQPLVNRVAILVSILLPLAGLIWAMAFAWGWGLGWVEVALLGVMYLLTGFGVTVGFHRYFTHKSFETSRPVAAILGILGSMSVEGPLLHWVSFHRRHHQHSDTENDPHSPHTHGEGFWSIVKGFWIAHAGWMFRGADTGLERYVPDLMRDKLARTISRLFPLWVLISLLIPAVLGGLLTWSWMGVFLGFVWGGLVRVLLIHHVTWSVNSVCHIWGTRPFRSHDESRNNPIVGVLALGEGWHNNHHAFPTSARHGLRWWEIDISYILIWCMARVGLVWNVRTPGQDRIVAKMRQGAPAGSG